MRQSTMRVKLRYFGPLKDAAGVAEQWRDLPEGGTLAELIAEVRGLLPAALLGASAFAVNQEYALHGRVLRDGDEVAILPPVSGGAS